ncbi:MAG: DNA-binding response regulator [Phenylobacterium zucineum]|nr:MAG: DNA-binding response regulator [Phenylobacterium zucineum]
MSLLRIFAVDDEQLALDRIQHLLARMPDVELVGTARTADSAARLIQRLRPAVVLLDIRLTGSDGFEIVQQLTAPDAPLVIFVTAFSEYAVEAFNVSATDFVTKPVEAARLRHALDKARAAIEARAAIAQARGAAPEPPDAGAEFWVEARGQFQKVLERDIDWLEAAGDYVTIHAAGGSYLLRSTLGGLESRLKPGDFIRVHRSAVVRRSALSAIARRGRGQLSVVVSGGRVIRVGRNYADEVRRLLATRAV